jgi:bacterial/archaeal transporter family-2 protein
VSKELAVLVTVAAGGLVAAQAPANNVVSERVGTWGAVSVNFLVGTVLVLVVTFAFAGGFNGEEGASTPPWYYWILGGLGGAAIVVTTLSRCASSGPGA